jgi:hypothetical protein
MANNIQLRATETPPGRLWAAGKYVLQFTQGGNLELWISVARSLLWQSGTKSSAVARLAMQEDGNLVIYDKRHQPLWSSGTDGNDSAYLTVQPDGNMVIYSQDNRPLWQTATAGR